MPYDNDCMLLMFSYVSVISKEKLMVSILVGFGRSVDALQSACL